MHTRVELTGTRTHPDGTLEQGTVTVLDSTTLLEEAILELRLYTTGAGIHVTAYNQTDGFVWTVAITRSELLHVIDVVSRELADTWDDEEPGVRS